MEKIGIIFFSKSFASPLKLILLHVKFKEIAKAYTILMDPTLRKVYTNEGAEAVEKFIKLDDVWYGGVFKALIKVWLNFSLKHNALSLCNFAIHKHNFRLNYFLVLFVRIFVFFRTYFCYVSPITKIYNNVYANIIKSPKGDVLFLFGL